MAVLEVSMLNWFIIFFHSIILSIIGTFPNDVSKYAVSEELNKEQKGTNEQERCLMS